MNKITVTLPDKTSHEYNQGITALEIAESIGSRLANDTVAASVDGYLIDATKPIENNCELIIHTGSSEKGHQILLHSAAHLTAQAVKYFWPNAKLTIGPAIENRYYYDFDIEGTFSDEDLLKIEDKMRDLSKNNYPCIRNDLTRDEAVLLFKGMGENYKLEILEDIPSDEGLTSYSQGDFVDLCRGPHVPSTGSLKYFKLLSTSGAYWRGDENNKMLQRIYGTVFSSKKGLNKYLSFLEEAKKRDHRKLGRELNIFAFDEEVGPGLPLWLPNGGVIINELEKLAKEKEDLHGYHQVRTPHLSKSDLYKKSGHLDLYRDAMFPAMDIDGTEYYVKPMNCPHHHKIYDATPKSYRDLPFRIAEYGTCYRYEKSGQLFGLMRVRSMQMNDAHIYCSNKDFSSEFLDVCKMYLEYFEIFGIDKYEMRLSLHDPKDLGKKYVNEPNLWLETEELVRKSLIGGDINFVEIPGEAAFYGPKVDVQVWSAIGKQFTLATNQVDFTIPKRFGLTYTDHNGESQTPLCIHRAPLSTHERFIGFLIEHYGGDFPLWLAPLQVVILPVSEKSNNYAFDLMKNLKSHGIRASVDNRSDKINAKVRQAELNKTPLMAIVGDKEVENNTVTVRRRLVSEQKVYSDNNFLDEVKLEINQRRAPYRES